VPPDCDVSIRPGWFYHAKEDSKVKSAEKLLEIYYKSVGQGASLLLNLPPDRRGKINENDARALNEFHHRLESIFGHNLASDARATASNIRGNDAHFAAGNVLDDRRETYWATDDSVTNAEVILEFKQPVTFNIVRLREYLPLGQRIEAFALDSWQVDCWTEFARGTSIGNCRLIRSRPLTTNKIRLRVIKAAVGPALSEVGVFAE
jgi:alpha-L-fucosidase